MRELIVGTRGSALALAQTEIVCGALRRVEPLLVIRVEHITTTGDVRSDVPLSQLGRGVFVTEIEAALRTHRIDIAVHSAKDLPSSLATDLTLGAILPREDARDVLVSRTGKLRDLPPGARVGTSSPRRACLLRALRPDVEPCDVRGNVDTRLRKLAAGEFDALVLAAAGLMRLGREEDITEWLDVDTMIPSVGQGALAVEARAHDEPTLQLLRRLDDAATRAAVTAERGFLAALGAGCQAAAGAYARVADDGRLHIIAFIGAPDGRHVRLERRGDVDGAHELGASVAHELLRTGGAAFLAKTGSALAGRRVAVTRAEDQSAELIALLKAHGALPVPCPTIAIAPIANSSELDATLRDLHAMQWLAFTSANAVHAMADRLTALGLRVPATVSIAAISRATASAVLARIRRTDFVPSIATADALAEQLPAAAGSAVCFPHGDLAREVLPARLRERGVRVRDVVVYRTTAGPGASELSSLVRLGHLDAIVFTSPSSVRFSVGLVDAMRVAPYPRPAIVCIGPTTVRAVRDVGLEPDAEAVTQSVGGIIESLERSLSARRRVVELAPR